MMGARMSGAWRRMYAQRRTAAEQRARTAIERLIRDHRMRYPDVPFLGIDFDAQDVRPGAPGESFASMMDRLCSNGDRR